MTKEEFEQKISKNEHKDEILRLVEESIKLMRVQNEQSVSKRYDECYKLFKDSNEDYTNFRLNVAKQMDILIYQLHCCKFGDSIQYAIQNQQQKIAQMIEDYAIEATVDITDKKSLSVNKEIYNNKLLINKIVILLTKYENARLFIRERINELGDKLQLLQLEKALKDGCSLFSIKLRENENQMDRSFSLQSKKAKQMFSETFIPSFINRFIEKGINANKEDSEAGIKKELQHLKSLASKKLVYKLVYDIYMIFIEHGVLEVCQANQNHYDLKDMLGNHYSLKGEVSDWIFFLLKKLGYITLPTKTYIKTDRNRYIKDCIKDKECRNLKLEDYSKNRYSPFL